MFISLRDNHAYVITVKSKQSGDRSILVVECLAVHEAFLVTIQKDIQWIIIQSVSQLIVIPRTG